MSKHQPQTQEADPDESLRRLGITLPDIERPPPPRRIRLLGVGPTIAEMVSEDRR